MKRLFIRPELCTGCKTCESPARSQLRQPEPSGGHDRVAPAAHPHLRRSYACLSLRDPQVTHDLPPLRSRRASPPASRRPCTVARTTK